MPTLKIIAAFVLGVTAGIVYAEKVLKPVNKEQSKSLYHEWVTLVFDCIDSCMLPDHFYKCYGLINNFDRWFRHDGRYKQDFENTLKSMWAYLDKRYRNVIDGNDLTIDELIN